MTAELILTNGRIYTVDPAQPWAEAVAIRDGRILAVGTTTGIEALAGPGTQRIDVGGRLVLPGLTDTHTHFLDWAQRRHQVNLFGLSDVADVRQRIAEATAATPPGQWLVGWGWDAHQWSEPPTAAMLDALAADRPAILTRMDMHTWWVNSCVLELAGITAATPDPPNSHIGRDSAGIPNGLLHEWSAWELVRPFLPRPTVATLTTMLDEAIGAANALGLTGIHDQRVEREGQTSLRLFQAARRDGRLNLRVHSNIAADYLPKAAQLGLQSGFGDDNLWLGHVKAFADGTMGSLTASMLRPFDTDPENTGVIVTSAESLWQLIVAAGEAGFPVSVHAIGDRAVRDVLDVMGEWTTTRAAVTPLPMPHRIEHVQLIHPDDLERLAQYNVVAAVQPVHIMTDWRTADSVWGERARYAYAFRSLLDRGTRLALGSDAPVAPLNPMLGIFAAVARQDVVRQDGARQDVVRQDVVRQDVARQDGVRQDGARQDEAYQPVGGWYPAERLTVAEAIAGYTINAAYLSGKADRLGSLSPGKYADLVVLSHDLFTIAPEAIPDTTAVLTIFNGRVVHEA